MRIICWIVGHSPWSRLPWTDPWKLWVSKGGPDFCIKCGKPLTGDQGT